MPRHGDAVDFYLLVERVGVEKAEGAHGLDVGGRAGVPDVEEVQLPPADLIRARPRSDLSTLPRLPATHRQSRIFLVCADKS